MINCKYNHASIYKRSEACEVRKSEYTQLTPLLAEEKDGQAIMTDANTSLRKLLEEGKNLAFRHQGIIRKRNLPIIEEVTEVAPLVRRRPTQNTNLRRVESKANACTFVQGNPWHNIKRAAAYLFLGQHDKKKILTRNANLAKILPSKNVWIF